MTFWMEVSLARSSLAGGDGDDTLRNGLNLDGGAGNDSLFGDFNSLVLGGDGNDYSQW